jgi:prolyl-tRNA editing enzyme YbaK/EbsC (Cys-tRNA(Pro) deacylase)
MSISKKITSYLEQKKYKYQIIEHKTTYTAWDTARTAQKQEKKIKPEEIVKALVMKADKIYMLALVSANKKLDKKKLLGAINLERKKEKLAAIKNIDFAKEAWMKKNIPGKVGATPPLLGLLGMEIFIDAALARQKNLYLGSGEYEYSIKVPAKQYLKNETPKKGSFSIKN